MRAHSQVQTENQVPASSSPHAPVPLSCPTDGALLCAGDGKEAAHNTLTSDHVRAAKRSRKHHQGQNAGSDCQLPPDMGITGTCGTPLLRRSLRSAKKAAVASPVDVAQSSGGEGNSSGNDVTWVKEVFPRSAKTKEGPSQMSRADRGLLATGKKMRSSRSPTEVEPGIVVVDLATDEDVPVVEEPLSTPTSLQPLNGGQKAVADSQPVNAFFLPAAERRRRQMMKKALKEDQQEPEEQCTTCLPLAGLGVPAEPVASQVEGGRNHKALHPFFQSRPRLAPAVGQFEGLGGEPGLVPLPGTRGLRPTLAPIHVGACVSSYHKKGPSPYWASTTPPTSRPLSDYSRGFSFLTQPHGPPPLSGSAPPAQSWNFTSHRHGADSTHGGHGLLCQLSAYLVGCHQGQSATHCPLEDHEAPVDITGDLLKKYMDRSQQGLQEDATGYSPNFGGRRGENLLWCHKYQPACCSEVCGNRVAVEELRSLLAEWQKDVLQDAPGVTPTPPLPRDPKGRNRQDTASEESSWFMSSGGDSDSDSMCSAGMAGGGWRAVALLGPPGCGKTSAVYACAREVGYRVLEVNPGMERTGAQVLKMVGEATQSQRFTLKANKAVAPQIVPEQGWPPSNKTRSSFERGVDGAAPAGRRSRGKKRVVEDLSEVSSGGSGASLRKWSVKKCKSQKGPVQTPVETASPPSSPLDATPKGEGAQNGEAGGGPTLTLVLFDEVDSLLDKDKGLLSSLAGLIQESKRPIILVLNKPHIPLALAPLNLRCLSFSPPPHHDLLIHLALVCTAEGVDADLGRLHRLVDQHHHDIRRTMMELQTWKRKHKEDECQAPQHPDVHLSVEVTAPRQEVAATCAGLCAAEAEPRGQVPEGPVPSALEQCWESLKNVVLCCCAQWGTSSVWPPILWQKCWPQVLDLNSDPACDSCQEEVVSHHAGARQAVLSKYQEEMVDYEQQKLMVLWQEVENEWVAKRKVKGGGTRRLLDSLRGSGEGVSSEDSGAKRGVTEALEELRRIRSYRNSPVDDPFFAPSTARTHTMSNLGPWLVRVPAGGSCEATGTGPAAPSDTLLASTSKGLETGATAVASGTMTDMVTPEQPVGGLSTPGETARDKSTGLEHAAQQSCGITDKELQEHKGEQEEGAAGPCKIPDHAVATGPGPQDTSPHSAANSPGAEGPPLPMRPPPLLRGSHGPPSCRPPEDVCCLAWLVAGTHHLSNLDVLGLPRDPKPSVSGPVSPHHQWRPMGTRIPRLGQNMAVMAEGRRGCWQERRDTGGRRGEGLVGTLSVRTPDEESLWSVLDSLASDDLWGLDVAPGRTDNGEGGAGTLISEVSTGLLAHILRSTLTDCKGGLPSSGNLQRDMPHQVMGACMSYPHPPQVVVASDVLLKVSGSCCVQGCSAVMDRMWGLASMARLEHLREACGASTVGRVRRAAKFQNYLKRMFPGDLGNDAVSWLLTLVKH